MGCSLLQVAMSVNSKAEVSQDMTIETAAFEQRLTWYTFNCALFAAVGSLLYGIDSGIISTTIAHPTFTSYFSPYTGE